MNTKLALGIVAAALIIAGGYLWHAHTRPVSPITQRDGLYYVGAENLQEGYVMEDGQIWYTRRFQYGDNQVRYEKFVVAGADPATFTLVTDAKYDNGDSVIYYWGKDKQNVFYQGQIMHPKDADTHAIDVATFSVVQNNYYSFAKDAVAVYEPTLGGVGDGDFWPYVELPGVDPATFAFIGDQCAQDKNNSYEIGYDGGVTKVAKIDPTQCTHPIHYEEMGD